jgi:hypothetical protein
MKRRKRLPRKIFISHAHQDRVFVAKLIKVLRRHGIKYWYSPKHIAGAQKWYDEIGKALAHCDWFLMVLSPHSAKSKWVKHEYLYVLNDDRFEEKIVPVIYKKCAWEKRFWTLQSLQWISFEQDYKTACQELLKIWGVKLKP